MSARSRPSSVLGDGLHYATPILSSKKTTEAEVVRCVLRMMQGLSSSLFYWDQIGRSFRVAKCGIYVTHLSYTSLSNILNQFMYSASCLQLVQVYVNRLKVESDVPTVKAFASSVSQWLQRLRDIALKEEVKICSFDVGITPTLLGLSSSVSSLCSGAECLLQIVHGAIPQAYFEPTSRIPASEMAVHILDDLYRKLDEDCLAQGGEEGAYLMALHIFIGSLLPYIECLDSWLFKGKLDDPFEEMFFYANRGISVDESNFWEKSYQLRQIQSRKIDAEHEGSADPLANNRNAMKENVPLPISGKGKESSDKDLQACPFFIKNIARSIVSAGKSLQLICHVPTSSMSVSGKSIDDFVGSEDTSDVVGWKHSTIGLTLSEMLCLSVAGLVGHGDHISKYVLQGNPCESVVCSLVSEIFGKAVGRSNVENLPSCVKNIPKKAVIDGFSYTKLPNKIRFSGNNEAYASLDDALTLPISFCPENPVLTVCQSSLDAHKDSWKMLNLSKSFHLPSLNDEDLRESLFGCENKLTSAVKGTDYAFGFQFGELEFLRSQEEKQILETLFPFPTILPSFQDDICMSELLPLQKNSTLASRFLTWIQNIDPRKMPLPSVIVQECLAVYIKKQVDYIGQLVLSKLMKDWRLMDELAILRAIYLLGSGDLLQHFLTIIFSKLDKGEVWDDDFELNLILQESIRNSADSMLLSAPDSLFVSISKSLGFDGEEQPSIPTHSSIPHKSHPHSSLDSLKFTYKVSWPLELIANTEAINKYNQVMKFLLKVKRAKFVLDKVRRWMWKGKGTSTSIHKRHCLVEQKLLHFVDAFHQYVMDRVYHSAWHELCERMAKAGSLDEVIEVHEAYLLSIQRQCFVVPDKMCALIASRINKILELALDFYPTQQTLINGGGNSATKARCEMKVDEIEKQFDDCIAFLLRILSFKLNARHFPHLADLVTRINYNYFYMSDTGNLMSSRPGKAFGGRTA